jgi:hypothetical protein
VACGGGSGSSSSGGSGGGSSAILFLAVVVILLLFACPPRRHPHSPFVARCSFRRPPLARLQRAMVGCCLLLSTAFVVARRSVIVDDCVTVRRPPAHLVALVLPATGAFVALHRRPLPATVLSITFAAPVNGSLLRSRPAQQPIN